ncbi:hypothetical protein [Flagellimonas sp.]|uniref:hypothetical protein n=1 Tax=Flagellimonas sp. TaxID=2058762 RepID=UPI003AB52827
MMKSEFKDRLRIHLFKVFVRACYLFKTFSLLSVFCQRYVHELHDGKPISFNPNMRVKGRTVLVLDHERFRGDVDIFSSDDRLRVLTISWGLLRYLLAAFVYEPTHKEQISRTSPVGIRWDFAKAKPGSKIYAQRVIYRSFLRRFLPVFLARLGVDMVMNSDFRYRREADITMISSELGIPHVCFYREAMYIVPAYYDLAVERHRDFGMFTGDLIAVQNPITKRMFVESNFAPAEAIRVRGCPRMDKYLSKVNLLDRATRNHRVTFFSCPKGAQLQDLTYFEFLQNTLDVVKTLTRFALENSNIEIVIKMKDLHFDQIPKIQDAILSLGHPIETLSNVQIVTDKMAAQDLILSSDIIIGMQSTVVLEAAVAGKAVVLPHLKNMRSRQGADQVLMYRDMYDLFEVVDDEDGLVQLLNAFYSGDWVPSKNDPEIRRVFDAHVSSLEAGATETSINILLELCEKNKDRSYVG